MNFNPMFAPRRKDTNLILVGTVHGKDRILYREKDGSITVEGCFGLFNYWTHKPLDDADCDDLINDALGEAIDDELRTLGVCPHELTQTTLDDLLNSAVWNLEMNDCNIHEAAQLAVENLDREARVPA